MLRELNLPVPAFPLFRALARRQAHTFLFESMEGPAKLARFSILGFNPEGFVELVGDHLRISGNLPPPADREEPLAYLRRARLEALPVDDGERDPVARGLPFDGGFVGFFGYDLVRRFERLSSPPPDDERYPDLQVGLYLDGIVYDHHAQKGYYLSHGRDRSRTVEDAAQAAQAEKGQAAATEEAKANGVAGHAQTAPSGARAGGHAPPGQATPASTPPRLAIGTLEPNVDPATFGRMVERAKRYIREGDVFQVVLSKRLRAPFEGDVLGFYEALRRTNPSPYMYCLNFGERHLIGASPEMLVRVTGDVVETFPIAGTRAVTGDPEEDDRLAAELSADEKERAEHMMLVDLARNDVGRVSRYGTVRVPELARVERYSHVQHLVSRVTGRLAPGRDALDAFAALFPAGTVSGAPKVRAMEIIDELEPTRRGPYAGCVGYWSLSGNLDAAITIRTLTATHSHVSIQAGAGIVADSDPAREWTETEEKARALVAALGQMEGPAGGEGRRKEAR